jgi:hypothetical protein
MGIARLLDSSNLTIPMASSGPSGASIVAQITNHQSLITSGCHAPSWLLDSGSCILLSR